MYRLRNLVLVTLTALLFAACGGPIDKSAGARTTEPAPVAKAATTPVENPQIKQAIVVFLSGEVNWKRGSADWAAVEVGQLLTENDVLKTGSDAYCEVQFGKTATVRIQADTSVTLWTIDLQPDAAHVATEVGIGAVLCKVSKLGGGEKFQVRTQSAVCGVRGTEFAVRVQEDQKTILAVRLGEVSVLPSSLDVQVMRNKVSDKADKVIEALQVLESQAPVVKENQEVSVGPVEVKKAEAVFASIDAMVSLTLGSSGGETATAAQVASLAEAVQSGMETISGIVTAPEPVSAARSVELETLAVMRLVEVPVAAAPPASASGTGTAVPAAAPALVKITLTVKPAEAQILLNGNPVGRGNFSGLFPLDDKLGFRARLDGYVENGFDLTVSKDSGKEYELTLVEEKEEIGIRAAPADAQILVDGRAVGRGTYTAQFQRGTQIQFTVRRDGYVEKSFPVAVSKGSGRTYEVTLEPEREEISVWTVPLDAEISLDGTVVGRGSYTGRFLLNRDVVFQVRREGYVAKDLRIPVRKGSGTSYEVRLEEEKEEFIIRTVPADAQISLNGRSVGRGNYTGQFTRGQDLSFTISRDGYVEKGLSVSVTKGSGRAYEVALEEEREEISVQVTPADADIMLNGRNVGRGSYTSQFTRGQNLSFTVTRNGYVEKSLNVPVGKGSSRTYEVTLEEEREQIAVRATPADAEIALNGNNVGRGSYTGRFTLGQSLSFTVTRDGYVEKSVSVYVSKGSGRTYDVALEEEREQVAVRTTPADADIALNGRSVGRGIYTGQFTRGQNLSFTVTRDGYVAKSVSVYVTKGSGRTYDVALEEEREQIVVRATPADAEIALNGNNVGRGSYTGQFTRGQSLSFTVTHEGYVEKNVSVYVTKGSGRTYEVALVEAKVDITVRARQADAEIVVNGTVVGRGAFTGRYAPGDRLSITVRRDGYVDQTFDATVALDTPRTFEADLREWKEEIGLNVRPADAEILLNGRKVASGAYRASFSLGERLSFVARSDGYHDGTMDLNVARGSGKTYEIDLEPKLLERSINVSTGKLVGVIAVSQGIAYAADAAGVVTASNPKGSVLWSRVTRNTPNENSSPVVFGDKVYFSGASELAVLDARTGVPVNRLPLSGASSHVFGRRVAAMGDSLLLPTDMAIQVFDAAGGKKLREFQVPEGSQMTPAFWGEKILIANQQGTFLVFGTDGTLETRIETRAVQPVALAPTIFQDKAFLCGRKGNVVCVDLKARRILWERNLGEKTALSVFSDIVCSEDGIFVWARGVLYGLSPSQGETLFSAISGVSAPPLIVGRQLIYPTEGKTLQFSDAGSGKTQRSIDLPARVVLRPAEAEGGRILAGTEDGNILVINPQAKR